MAEELFIPKLGQTVEEVTLLNWLVKDGDRVEQGQEVLEVETDKAVFNVEAVDSGYIHFGPYNAGEVVPVLAVVAVIGGEDEKFAVKTAQPQETAPEPEKTAEKKTDKAVKPAQAVEPVKAEKVFVSPRARKLAAEKNVNLNLVTPSGGKGVRICEADVLNFLTLAPKISPVARKMAAAANLDLRTIVPSGPRGEITRADVEMALAKRTSGAGAEVEKVTPPLAAMQVSESIPLKGVRGVIAERMGMSAHTTARVTLFLDADATKLVAYREKLKAQVKDAWGFAPGYNDLLVQICARALADFPYMNARLNGEVIERLAEINIGVAVDAEKGLYVPVIRDAGKKSLKTIGAEFRQRVDEIRGGKILPDHLSGGTFTITNLGMYDIEGFTPVINFPEAAILGVGKIIPKPVVVENELVIRQMLTLSLTFDHRITDGAPAARFLQAIKDMINTPEDFLFIE
jgi:pyruvate dehydrogenase E2 component (dihydrolipoamide acetyltransferase)